MGTRGDIDSRRGARSQRAASRLISTPGAVPPTNDETNPISPNPCENQAPTADQPTAKPRAAACRPAPQKYCPGQDRHDCRLPVGRATVPSPGGAMSHQPRSTKQTQSRRTPVKIKRRLPINQRRSRGRQPAGQRPRRGARSQRAASRLISTPGAVPTKNDETNPISPNPHGNNAFPANGSPAPTARDGCRAAQSRSRGFRRPLLGQSFYGCYRAPHSRWFFLALGRPERGLGWGDSEPPGAAR